MLVFTILREAALVCVALTTILTVTRLVAAKDMRQEKVHGAPKAGSLDKYSKSRWGIVRLAAIAAVAFTALLFALTLDIKFPHMLKIGFFALVGVGMILATWTSFCDLFMSKRARWIAGGVCAAIIACFALWPNWLTVDLLGLVMIMSYFGGITNIARNFRTVAAIVGGMAVYDLVNVFITGRMLKAVAGVIGDGSNLHSHIPPFVLVLPENLSLNAGAVGLLGLGDIIAPGVLVVMAGLLAYRLRKPGVVYAGLAGYLLGMVLTVIALLVTHRGQPALIYLFPCVTGAITLAAWRTGMLRQLYSLKPKGATEVPAPIPA